MRNRVVPVALSASLALVLGLSACGGTNGSSASTNQDAKTELSSTELTNAAFAASPIDESQAFDIKVGVVKDGKCTITFGSTYGDFSYTIDAYTGEVLEKSEPTEALEEDAKKPLSTGDPIDLATSACLDAYDTNGKETNVKVKARTDDGVKKVRVQFDLEGEHYDLDYDVETGKITPYSAETEETANETEKAKKKKDAEAEARMKAEKATEEGTKQLSHDEATGMAIDACWAIYQLEGDLENLTIRYHEDDGVQKVDAEFSINGKFYEVVYDVATGVVTEKTQD